MALCCLAAAPLAAAPADGAEALRRAVRQRGLEPEQLIWPWEPGPHLRDWLARQAVGRRPAERLEVVFHQLLAAGGKALAYDAGSTGTADEVFASGRANCLGFTLLFVGLARELDLEAGFFRITRRPSYHREDDLIFISEHVTGGYEVDGQLQLVEFTLAPEVDYSRAVAISDLTAMALFYSNRGAEALRDGDAGEAVRWLEVAVRLDEREASALTNLGVARRRLGQLSEAETVYRRAIELDPDHLPAYINLAGVLRMRGARDAAREIVALLDRGDNRNPWAYLALGDASLEEGRPDDAKRYYRRAVRLGRGDAEPRAAMGLLALSRGDTDGARRWLRRARRIDGHDKRTLRLEQKLTERSPTAGAAASAAGPEQSEREVES